MADLAVITDTDQMWAIGKMDLFAGAIAEAADAADELIANWNEGKNVARFWPGQTLNEVMQSRYPTLGMRQVQRAISAGMTRAYVVPELTEGMSDRALREVPVTEQVPTHGSLGGSTAKVSAEKVAEVEEVLTEARDISGGAPPTAAQVKQAKQKVKPSLPPAPVLAGSLSPEASHLALSQAWARFRDEMGQPYHDPAVVASIEQAALAMDKAFGL